MNKLREEILLKIEEMGLLLSKEVRDRVTEERVLRKQALTDFDNKVRQALRRTAESSKTEQQKLGRRVAALSKNMDLSERGWKQGVGSVAQVVRNAQTVIEEEIRTREGEQRKATTRVERGFGRVNDDLERLEHGTGPLVDASNRDQVERECVAGLRRRMNEVEQTYEATTTDLKAVHQAFLQEQQQATESLHEKLHDGFQNMQAKVDEQIKSEEERRDESFARLEQLVMATMQQQDKDIKQMHEDVAVLKDHVGVMEHEHLPEVRREIRDSDVQMRKEVDDKLSALCAPGTGLVGQHGEKLRELEHSTLKEVDRRLEELKKTSEAHARDHASLDHVRENYPSNELFGDLETNCTSNFDFFQQELNEKSEWLERLEKQAQSLIEQEQNRRREALHEKEVFYNKRFSALEGGVQELVDGLERAEKEQSELREATVGKAALPEAVEAARRQLKDLFVMFDQLKTGVDEFQEEQKLVVGFLDTQQKAKFQALQKDVKMLTKLYGGSTPMPGGGVLGPAGQSPGDAQMTHLGVTPNTGVGLHDNSIVHNRSQLMGQ